MDPSKLFAVYRYGSNEIEGVFINFKECEAAANKRNEEKKITMMKIWSMKRCDKFDRMYKDYEKKYNKFKAIPLEKAISDIHDLGFELGQESIR
jgi:hypothetical protein